MARPCSFRFIIASVFVCACSIKAKSQDTLLPVSYKGRLDSINSTVLHQRRYIQVFLPKDYKAGSTDTYDVLYVLDGGNWNMSVIEPVQNFIRNEGHMPPTIIVSVMGIDRNVELTPTVLKTWNAPTGGADKFLAYIKDELVPYINKNYPSDGDNSIWGHSLGGMFVTYALLKEPALFKSYIAVDPSLWWDDAYVPKMAAVKMNSLHDSTITYFMSGRQGFALQDMKIDTMETTLKRYAPANLKWKLSVYPNETHASLRMKSTYDGLMFAYEGMTTGIEFRPMNGIVAAGKPYTIFYDDDTSHVHYTIDGTMPAEQSPQVNREITVTGPAKVIYKRISNRNKYSRFVTGDFITEKLAPPLSTLRKGKPGGLHFDYYENLNGDRPDLKKMKPVKSGIVNKAFSADSLPRKTNYLLVMNGYLEIKEPGYYSFFAKAGKGSRIWIDGRPVFYWDEKDKRDIYSYMLPLEKGFYPLRIESVDKKEDYNFLFYYITPSMPLSGDPVPVPPDLEYSHP